ncbi:cytochrome o ubiquinol oxidase subunit IV [Sphingomonas aliaeris]|uniref:Cytochrome bo(3) ubiquinol oxidase subunit 4 n=1 Tax=Sphingomonas aliaeris TaxID=2759526 RepID=A0A974NUZ3_9SPHN|nr:cytochrome o ubiquinol oxidase subunit IV [Sphingomonas aliaeris]QQV77463.1 cytochrome o ubiquinol oxidase subunit IV [Sphingomonas aliaeris]
MSGHDRERRRDETGTDLAPGEDTQDPQAIARRVRGYVIGLVLAAVLTAASFWALRSGVIYGPGIPVALVALAIAQMGVHLVFFLHITTGPDNANNVLALAFGVLIVALVLIGSIWIMANLNHNTMPAHMMQQMQR